MGTVADSSGGSIAGARVKVSGPGQALDASVDLYATGGFPVALPAGIYTLKVSKDGFIPALETVNMTQRKLTPFEVLWQVAPLVGVITVTEGAGYLIGATSTATKTLTPLRDVPQSITVVTQTQIRDQLMMSIADVVP